MPELPPPQVWFRGPMLVLTRGDEVDSILIPDAKEPMPVPGSTGAKLRSHSVGMFLTKNGATDSTPNGFGRGFNLLIDDGTSEICTADWDGVVSVDGIVNTGDKESLRPVGPRDERVAATVRFSGGDLAGQIPCMGTYKIPGDSDPRKLNVTCVWTAHSDHATIELVSRTSGDHFSVITLGPGEAAFVYNFDCELSNPDVFRTPGPCADNEVDDKDFGWVYCLLAEPSDGWTEWLDGDELLVPRHSCTPAEIEESKARARRESEEDRRTGRTTEVVLSPDDGDCLFGYFDINA